jgi:hypothetical protein
MICKTINVTHHIKTIKGKNIIISTDSEKGYDKFNILS